MAAIIGNTINLVTSGTTANNTRAISSVITAAGTNLSIVPMHLQYQKRYVESGKKFLFFLNSAPTYLPQVGQEVLVHHLDVAPSSALAAYFQDKSTNVATATFVRLVLMTNTATIGARDGFIYAMELMYDDDTLGYIAGNCNGALDYDTSPLAYDILKPIESNVIVTERVPYDDVEGVSMLFGTTTGTGQTTPNIAPMLFVDSGASNTIFSNLYKSFNLPITTTELAEFTHSPYGIWTDSASGALYHDGKKGDWVQDIINGTMIHPVSGYTGQFYDTVYEHLGYEGGIPISKILVMEIPQAQYGEIIDGKSVKINLPKTGGGTNFYSIYGAYKKNIVEYGRRIRK
jgi:hypothetical protein